MKISNMKEAIGLTTTKGKVSGRTNYSIAKESGLTQNQVKDYLDGRVQPSIDKFISLMETIGYEVSVTQKGRESIHI